MGAFLPNLEPILAAGIDPKTGLPVKFDGGKFDLKERVKHQLRVIDEQDAINRYVWYNLPNDLTSQELERMLYYRYQLCFFYCKDDGKFYFMPAALDGSIDFYGRWNRVHPIPWSFGNDDEQAKLQAKYLSTIKLNCVYGIKYPEDLKPDTILNSCVLLYDYSKQQSQMAMPRVNLQDPLLDAMAECIPYMRTSLINSTGVKGVRVNDADQADSVAAANKSLQTAAQTGNQMVPIVGQIEIQELADGQVGKSEEFMLAMQSLDNFRLSTYGIDNGGLFEKKVQELQTEADINGGPVGLVLQDGLSIRQNFCNIANSIWGTAIWCEPAENIIGADTDGDGLKYNRNTNGSNSGMEGAIDGADDSTI